jgi:trk system potassium uptake protein TrkH
VKEAQIDSPRGKRGKIGDRIIRLPRPTIVRIPIVISDKGYFSRLLFSNPVLLGVLGIALLMLGGGLLLMLPVANVEGHVTPPLIAFFASTSAVSTTGLGLVTTATYWTTFGQAVICGLIFAGGLGLVAIVMFILWAAGSRFSLQDRLITREAMGVKQIGGLLRLLRYSILVDISITIIGAILLIIPFNHYYSPGEAIWQAFFHSVSSFNTAGIDIVGPSGFIVFRNDTLLLSIVTIVAILGAIGFFALFEIPRVRRFNRFSLDTKIVIITTFTLYLLGALGTLISEWFLGTTLSDFSVLNNGFTSFFNAVSASTTTGFTTIDFSQVTVQTMIIITGLMFVGGSTASTAGGIKVNAFGVLVATIWGTLKGRSKIEAFRREIISSQILRAIATLFVSLTVLFTGILLIMSSSPGIPFEKVLFEASSALGNAGLSTGVLAEFSNMGKIVVIFLMFVGRVAPLSIISIFVQRRKSSLYRFPTEEVHQG